jgi:hypothetical protein
MRSQAEPGFFQGYAKVLMLNRGLSSRMAESRLDNALMGFKRESLQNG